MDNIQKVFSEKINGGYICPDGIFRKCPSGIARVGKYAKHKGRWRVSTHGEHFFFTDVTYEGDWKQSLEAAIKFLRERESILRVAGTHRERKAQPTEGRKVSKHIWITQYKTKAGIVCNRFSISVGKLKATVWLGTENTLSKNYATNLKRAKQKEEELLLRWKSMTDFGKERP